MIHKCQKCKQKFEGTSRARFCKKCRKIIQSEQSKKWYKNNKEKHKESMKRWEEKNREARLQYRLDWWKNKYHSNPEFKEQELKRSKKWAKDNPDKVSKNKQDYHARNRTKINQYSVEWRDKNFHKVAAYNLQQRGRNPIDPEIIKRVFAKCEYKCIYCESTKSLSLEHLIPVKRDGSDEESNLAVSCKSCNSSKHKKTHEEFLAWRTKYKVGRYDYCGLK